MVQLVLANHGIWGGGRRRWSSSLWQCKELGQAVVQVVVAMQGIGAGGGAFRCGNARNWVAGGGAVCCGNERNWVAGGGAVGCGNARNGGARVGAIG